MLVPASPDPLGPVHASLADLWAAAERTLATPPDPTWRGEFATAVGEIAANIARHAFPDPTVATFEFRWQLHANGVAALFRDPGSPLPGKLPDPTPMEPRAAAPPQELPEGGWGLSLARAALDDLRYSHRNGENRWILMKRLPE